MHNPFLPVSHLHTQKKYEPDSQFSAQTQALNEYSHSQWEINSLPVWVTCSLHHQSETQSCPDNALSLSQRLNTLLSHLPFIRTPKSDNFVKPSFVGEVLKSSKNSAKVGFL